MAAEFIIIYSSVLAERNNKIERRRLLKHLRDTTNPFSLQESVLMQTFRMPRSLCWELIQQLEPHDSQRTGLHFPIRFVSILYFYAHGSYQKFVGTNYTVPMSQASVSRCLGEISKLIITVKGSEIHFPETVVKTGFHSMYGIKGTIGAIDRTHIAIASPPANDVNNPLSLYMNRNYT